MADLEQAYNDVKSWCYFNGENEIEIIGVYCRCPECSRYVKRGHMLINKVGMVKFKGFTCKVHGEIQPYYDRNF